MEKTFLMVKPDGVQRGLMGSIISRFEQKGFQCVAGKFVQMTREQAEAHYAEHQGKPFFEDLVQFITSGPVFASVWQGDDIIALSRAMIGKTNVLDAQSGTIRGDYASHTRKNLIHGSDSPQSAEREIRNFFSDDEIVKYDMPIQQWI